MVHGVLRTVRERIGGAAQIQGHQHRIVRDGPQREQRHTRQRLELRSKMGIAAAYFIRRGLVLAAAGI